MTTLTVTAGPPDATTDPESGIRYYHWQGRPLPSVTTIRRQAGMPHGLHEWTITQVVDRAVLDHATLTAMLTRERRPRERVLEKNRIAEASRWLRGAATEQRDLAAALGTAVHDLAAQRVSPDAIPELIEVRKGAKVIVVTGDECRSRLVQFYRWLETSGSRVLLSEYQVWNLTVGYGGTVDLLTELRDGRRLVVDIKTGESTYAEHALQVVPYRRAEFVGNDGVVADDATALHRSATGAAILHLSDDAWEFRLIRDDASTWRAFQGLLLFAGWMTANPSVEHVTLAKRTNRIMEEAAA